MADINKKLLETSGGTPGPQHKTIGKNEFEWTEGSDGALHMKIVDSNGEVISDIGVKDEDVRAELESIKQTQSEILDKLNGTIDTQLTGSNMEDGLIVLDKASQNKQKVFLKDETIGAGSNARFTYKLTNNRISLFVRMQKPHDWKVSYRASPNEAGTIVGSFKEVVKGDDTSIGNGSLINPRYQYIEFEIVNLSDEKQKIRSILITDMKGEGNELQ